ncbi:TPA: hypothetical protein ACLBZ1_005434 [Bacillus cereus]
MARKNKSLTGFDDIATSETKDDKNETINNGENKTSNKIINESQNETLKNNKNNIKKESITKLDELLTGKKEEKNKATTLYLEPEVSKVLDKVSGTKKKGGRSGKKSQIVNEILKEFFRSRDLMD